MVGVFFIFMKWTIFTKTFIHNTAALDNGRKEGSEICWRTSLKRFLSFAHSGASSYFGVSAAKNILFGILS